MQIEIEINKPAQSARQINAPVRRTRRQLSRDSLKVAVRRDLGGMDNDRPPNSPQCSARRWQRRQLIQAPQLLARNNSRITNCNCAHPRHACTFERNVRGELESRSGGELALGDDASTCNILQRAGSPECDGDGTLEQAQDTTPPSLSRESNRSGADPRPVAGASPRMRCNRVTRQAG
jgi:hypothetical protein